MRTHAAKAHHAEKSSRKWQKNDKFCHEDMIELAWALGEAIGEEIDESELSEDFTIGELWRFVRDKEENAQE